MIVKKYGGSALASPQHIENIAQHIASEYKKNPEPTLIVVSAMGETTNELLQLGHELSHRAPARELDMLISAGERISMALMSIALQKHGCPSISFTGSQAGIMTSSKHGYAYIHELKPIRVDEELKKNKIVVIAGFQGVDPLTKEVTTLGRGGTDTTAVALAAHYKARSCELYKDVAGILTAPPQLVPQTQLIPHMHYDELLSLCYWGSKVVQHRAVELAKRFSVPLKIGSWKDHRIGTLINNDMEKNKTMESVNINAISVFEPILTVSYRLPLDQAICKLMDVSRTLDLPFPTLVASTAAGEGSRLMVTGHKDWIGDLFTQLQTESDIEKVVSDHVGIMIQGMGLENGTALVSLIQKLQEAQVQIDKVLKDPQGILFSFPHSEKEKALEILRPTGKL